MYGHVLVEGDWDTVTYSTVISMPSYSNTSLTHISFHLLHWCSNNIRLSHGGCYRIMHQHTSLAAYNNGYTITVFSCLTSLLTPLISIPSNTCGQMSRSEWNSEQQVQ